MIALLEAARQALDALTYQGTMGKPRRQRRVAAITALRAAITEAEAQPYDQQSLELCETCGWKAVIPGEPCLVCERNAKPLGILEAIDMCVTALEANRVPRKAIEQTLEKNQGE